MKNEDYQLEELENEAVNKSNNAKRIAAAAGLLATGGAAGYAATEISETEPEPIETLTEDDLDDVVESGASQVHEPEHYSQPVQTTPNPVPHDEPTTPEVEEDAAPEKDIDVSFDKTTHYIDEDFDRVMTEEEGTINGHRFVLRDVNGDMRADVLGYDADGNGVINEDEIVELSGKDQIAMGHATAQHEDVFVTTYGEPEPYIEPYDIDDEKDYAQENIENDFEDEKTGEMYSHDYAENNDDYDNGDPEPYSASQTDDSDYAYDEVVKDDTDYAYDEVVQDEGDDEYEDLAENDTTEDTFEDVDSDIDIV